MRADLARGGNTFDAHRLVQLAKAHGVQDAMKERLMRAYHTEGEAIGDTDTLARLALEVGLPEDEVRDVLASDRYAADVREDERTAMSLGINAVPFFVVDRRMGAAGAHPPRGPRRAAAARLGGAGARMKQIGFITQGHAEYDERLRALLDASGIDPEEFLGLEYFSLTPFFVLAGATVGADAHTHGTEVHVSARAHHDPRGARGGVPRDAARAARGRLRRRGMTAAADARVCPHCGEPPGEGVFCAACGRNLASVDRLPTRAEWEVAGAQDDRPLAERCEEATAAFLAAMHAAGDPGTTKHEDVRGLGLPPAPSRSRAGSSARSIATSTFRPSATSPASCSASRAPSTSSTTRPAATARATSPSGSTRSRRSRSRCRSSRA